jgi:hypothetical protein
VPRDYFRQLFDERVKARKPEIVGETVSPFVIVPFDNAATLMHVADVSISGTIVSAIPLHMNNRDLIYANPGTPVKMDRSASGRLEIVGRAKRGFNAIYSYTLSIPVLTPDASNSGSALTGGVLTSVATTGIKTRMVTLGELATATTGGFGETPLQAYVLTDFNGTILNIIG